MASGSKSVDDRSNWHAVNMVPMNPHCTHSPEKARTPSPRNFFSYHFPDAGVYRKLYAAIRQGKNPWMKNNDDDEKIETESPPKTPDLPTNDEIDHQPVMMNQKGGDVESIASSSPMATPVQVRDVADSVVSVHTLDATPVEADADAGHGTGPRVEKKFAMKHLLGQPNVGATHQFQWITPRTQVAHQRPCPIIKKWNWARVGTVVVSLTVMKSSSLRLPCLGSRLYRIGPDSRMMMVTRARNRPWPTHFSRNVVQIPLCNFWDSRG